MTTISLNEHILLVADRILAGVSTADDALFLVVYEWLGALSAGDEDIATDSTHWLIMNNIPPERIDKVIADYFGSDALLFFDGKTFSEAVAECSKLN